MSSEINWVGVAAIIVFYILILLVGVYASWRGRQKIRDSDESAASQIMVANRDIGVVVGCITMTATWVGGGYINGSAEIVFTSGLVWCQTYFGYSISLVLGGLLFAGPLRRREYTTMLDPLQEQYGRLMGALLFIPALCGEVFWSASILAALGSSLVVILHLNHVVSIVVSASVAVLYTLFGGLLSVAYTDVVQLFFIIFGLWLSIPFALTHSAVGSLDPSVTDWVGTIDRKYIGQYVDFALLLIFGGIPWQVYFQRVLSTKSARMAQVLSIVAGFGCFVMAIPAIIVGIIAKATDWSQFTIEDPSEHPSVILPTVLQYLTPQWVSFFGLGAVSAAVMSSADSSVLSASSLFTRNVYNILRCGKASDTEQVIILRISIFCVAVLATGLAVSVKTIYGLHVLCADLVYVILFPQLLLAIYFRKYANMYGSMMAFVVGIVLRFLGGEPLLHIPATIYYPYFTGKEQLFPFRTAAMLCSLVSHIIVSLLFHPLVRKEETVQPLHVASRVKPTQWRSEFDASHFAMDNYAFNYGNDVKSGPGSRMEYPLHSYPPPRQRN